MRLIFFCWIVPSWVIGSTSIAVAVHFVQESNDAPTTNSHFYVSEDRACHRNHGLTLKLEIPSGLNEVLGFMGPTNAWKQKSQTLRKLLRSTPLRKWQARYTNYSECGLAIQVGCKSMWLQRQNTNTSQNCEGKAEKCIRLQQWHHYI